VFGANPGLTPSQAQTVLVNNTDDLGAAGWDTVFGYGRVNASKAVAAALGGGPAPADTTPPTASITSPAAGSTVSGTVNVAASASDNVGVTKVEFYVDGTLAGTTTTTPYTFAWDTTAVTNVTHSLVAKAYDAAGNTGPSASVGVTVQNTTGPVLVTETFTGNLGGKNQPLLRTHTVTVNAAGPMNLNLTWGGKAKLKFDVYDASNALVATGTAATVAAAPGSYRVVVSVVSGHASYTLTVSHY
jgi:hypothetical protein